MAKLPWYVKNAEWSTYPPSEKNEKIIELYKYRNVGGLYLRNLNMTRIAKFYVFFRLFFSGKIKMKIKIRKIK